HGGRGGSADTELLGELRDAGRQDPVPKRDGEGDRAEDPYLAGKIPEQSTASFGHNGHSLRAITGPSGQRALKPSRPAADRDASGLLGSAAPAHAAVTVSSCWDTGVVLGVLRNELVGREYELSHLLAVLDSAASGRPVVTLISGDAGVGKTRLVTELAARARERHFTVLSGGCAELGDAVPYLPLADALRDAVSGPSPGASLLDALAARPVLSRLLPDRNESGPAGGDMPGLVQQQLFGAVLGLLTELAAASPLLLILEDVHWADQSTRDPLTFLSRMLHTERLAVVATYRSDDIHRRHPLRPLVAE